MLAGKGFEQVFNVSGGINAWQSKIAVGPQDLGMDLFSGEEAPLDVLKVAYSLEQGLQEFYVTLEKQAKNEKIKALFSKLSEIEVKHQLYIYKAYTDISKQAVNKDVFEKMVETKALEGGLSTSEYLARFKPDLSSETEVISLAMSIEAQALDLYQRVASKIADKESKDIVIKIANEEKAHLASLGKLMDSL
jgi:rubrerythrin